MTRKWPSQWLCYNKAECALSPVIQWIRNFNVIAALSDAHCPHGKLGTLVAGFMRKKSVINLTKVMIFKLHHRFVERWSGGYKSTSCTLGHVYESLVSAMSSLGLYLSLTLVNVILSASISPSQTSPSLIMNLTCNKLTHLGDFYIVSLVSLIFFKQNSNTFLPHPPPAPLALLEYSWMALP